MLGGPGHTPRWRLSSSWKAEAGKPKLGKSWLALSLAEAIAAGGVAFGVKRVEQGKTLYLALEDNHRRLQGRLKKVLE
jgi:RecA-family ATPase